MTTTTRPRRFTGTADERAIIPAGVKLPPAVGKANDRLRAAHDRHAQARVELRAARDAIAQAAGADTAAARSAAAAGKQIPDRTEPQAQVAFAAAERRLQAEEGAVVGASRELAEAIFEGRPKWLGAQREAVESGRTDALAAIDALVSRLDQLAADEAVLGGLEQFGDGGSLIGVNFSAGERQRIRDRKLDQQRVAVEANRGTAVPRDLPSVLGALRLLVEGYEREPLVLRDVR